MFAEIFLGLLFASAIFRDRDSDNYRYIRDDSYDRYREEHYQLERAALSDFNSRKQELISSFSTQLAYDLQKNLESDFCEEKMNEQKENDLNSKLNEYIDKIVDNENGENLVSLRIDNSLEKLSKQMSELEVKHLNILLLGPSGVGKSTLINSILKLDEDKMAKADITKPTTKAFNVYESQKISNIRLIDSRGIEKGDYNIDEFVNEVTKYIESSELSGNPDNFIHCIWYCITGTRFEDIEEKTLSKLASIYDDSKLPIIVVYTQAIIPNYYNAINNEINKINKEIEFIPIVAKDIELSEGKVIKPKNIDKLLLISLEKSKNAVYSSVFSSLRKIVKKEIDIENENNANKAKNLLKENVPIKADDTDDISNCENDEEKKLENIFKLLLFGPESQKDLNEDSKLLINELINKLKEKNNEIMGSCLLDFIDKRSEDLLNKLIDLQAEINTNHNGNLKQYKSSGQFKEEVFPPIINSLNNLINGFGMDSLQSNLIDLISEKVQNDINTLISSDSTKNNLNAKIKNQFQRIISIVQGFNF